MRPRALITPAVTVVASPWGLPMAMASCPTRRRSELPSSTAGNCPPKLPCTRTTARSVRGSVPTTSAAKVRPSGRLASSCRACSTTWLLVRMYPSGVITKPEPAPRTSKGPRCVRTSPSTERLTTDGPTRVTAPLTARE